MIQKLIDQPWIAIAFAAIIFLLWCGALMRIKHDRMLQPRARVDRRNKLRAEQDRRWQARTN
jgi:hypothetical protein